VISLADSGRRRRSMAVLVLPLLALTFSIAAPPSGAQAVTPSCYHNSCDGRNPAATNCSSSPTTAASVTAYYADRSSRFPIARIDLRYSPLCHAWWARTVIHRATYAREGYLHYLGCCSTYKRYGKFYSGDWRDGVTVWTGMQSDWYDARACGYEWVFDAYLKERVACTDWTWKHPS
jgi:hypothetical protein